jgi:hypothetical protein
MGKEIKIGLAVTGLLLGVFAIVLGISLYNSDTPRAAADTLQAEGDDKDDAKPAPADTAGRPRRPITVAADDANEADPDQATANDVDPWSEAAHGAAPSDPGLDYMPDPQRWTDDAEPAGRDADRYADYVSARSPDLSAGDFADADHPMSHDEDSIAPTLDDEAGFAAGATTADDPGAQVDLAAGAAAYPGAADAMEGDAADSHVVEADAGDVRSAGIEGAGVGEPDHSEPAAEPPHGAYFDRARQRPSRHRDTAPELMPSGSNAAPISRVYAVHEGDTLFGIARLELGRASRWAEIYDLNRDQLGEVLSDLPPGMQLLLPAGERPSSAFTSRAPTRQ